MNETHACLDPGIVGQIGRDELPPNTLRSVEDHISTCVRCREMFTKAMQEPEWTERILPVLRERQAENAGLPLGDEPSQNESLLRMLGPSDDPRMLGRIGPYEVIGVVGSGGMGVVFKAFDPSLDRIVAIKMLLPHLATSSVARKRFSREGRAAAAVIDDHVAPIYGVDEWQGVPYLVTQYSNGVSLQKRIREQGPLELQETLRISIQASRGLAAAHAQGLVHRDVKPSNILLDRTVERALLTDFGLARAADDASITRTGTIAGTPHYMSPEQVQNEPIDARSDLFSLGCTIYAMCTGHPPFRAESSYAVLRRIADDTPRPIREVNESIPEWFERIIMRLLSKSPTDRFQSAAEVAELLENCLAHVQQPTTTPLPISAEQLLSRRGELPPIARWLAMAVVAFALLSAGVLIVVETNKGTLTIESDLDNVPIRITQDNQIVKRMIVTKRENSVRIAAGTYAVEIDGQFDGVVVEGEKVLLRRGDLTKVEVVRQTEIAASKNVGSDVDVAEAATADKRDKVIVELYCGADVAWEENSKNRSKANVRLLEELNAIEDVIVGFRVLGPGNEISKAIVRDPWMRSRRGAVATDKPSEKQVAITAVLRSAGIPKIGWTYGGDTMIHDVSRASRALVLLMHPPHVPDGNALQQAATSVVLGQLTASDYAGVVTFTPDGPEWAWGEGKGLVQIGERRAQLLKSIVDLKVADTPEYDTALRLALNAFVNVKAEKKQMLILTNGDPSLRDPAVLNELKENDISVTVVHVTNSGAKYARVPKQIAARTGGKYIHVDQQTVKTSAIEDLVRRETEPAVARTR